MAPNESPPPRFEEALAELEAILRELEDGATSLEDSLARYERGVGLLRRCYDQLQQAEQKVRLLAGLSDTGGADLKPFEHMATVESAKAAARKGGKTGGTGVSQ
jgi:exodeoxyribonuclease VII small subunit